MDVIPKCIGAALLVAASMAPPVSAQDEQQERTYCNPLGDLRMGDPFVLRHDGLYYLYGTNAGDGFKCWTSTDLVEWTPTGYAYRRKPDSWGRSTYWAPEVIRYRDKFYMVYSCMREREEGYRLCLAVADTPAGPFRDLHAPWFDNGWSCIDGDIFVDDDGTPYLFFDKVGVVGEPWKEPSEGYIYGMIYAVRLAEDLSVPVGEPVLCLQADQEWEEPESMHTRCNEGAFVLKRHGVYHMTYSANNYTSPNYGIGHATAPAPLGPWTKSPDNPLVAKDIAKGISGPGHSSITVSPDGRELFMVYHAHADVDRPSGNRTVNIDRLVFEDNDRLTLIGPTRAPQPMPSANASDIKASASGHLVTYRGETLLLVGESGTQCVMQNANIDYRAWIDDCAERGIRAVHIWAFVPPRQKADGTAIEERYGYLYPGMTPWARKADGPAATDGLPQWDLTTFDEGEDTSHYWPRLRDLCGYAAQKRMLVGITVFFGWPKWN